jgi:hypothetical protein
VRRAGFVGGLSGKPVERSGEHPSHLQNAQLGEFGGEGASRTAPDIGTRRYFGVGQPEGFAISEEGKSTRFLKRYHRVGHGELYSQPLAGRQAGPAALGPRESLLERLETVWQTLADGCLDGQSGRTLDDAQRVGRRAAPFLGDPHSCFRSSRGLITKGSIHRRFLHALGHNLHVVGPVLLATLGWQLALGLLITWIERWSLGDGVYFTFVTGLTIGYGDLVPHQPLSRFLAILVGFLGTVLTGLVAAIAVRALQTATDDLT